MSLSLRLKVLCKISCISSTTSGILSSVVNHALTSLKSFVILLSTEPAYLSLNTDDQYHLLILSTLKFSDIKNDRKGTIIGEYGNHLSILPIPYSLISKSRIRTSPSTFSIKESQASSLRILSFIFNISRAFILMPLFNASAWIK